MSFKIGDLFKFKKWQPDLSREQPPKSEWPDHIITLDNDKFDDFVDKFPVVVIDFWAPWCQPCKALGPRLRQVSKIYRGKVAFGKVNIDNYKDLAKRFHILSIPNLMFFSYGEKVTNLMGVRPIKEIQIKIDGIIKRFES